MLHECLCIGPVCDKTGRLLPLNSSRCSAEEQLKNQLNLQAHVQAWASSFQGRIGMSHGRLRLARRPRTLPRIGWLPLAPAE